MQLRTRLHLVAAPLIMVAGSCQPVPPSTAVARLGAPVPPTPLVLALEQGERRVRRLQSTGLSAPFILKVDAQNGGSQDLVMGYEDIPPGQSIAAHRHLLADEIIFVHAGSGIAELGDTQTPFETGATIYIPKNVRISVRNTGSSPLSIAFIFSRPGFEEYLRATSALEGESVVPLSTAERAAIREQHKRHTQYGKPRE